jgi:hypothetical protein
MTHTDYRQIYRCTERAASELRGLAARLRRERDEGTAAIVDRAVDELNTRWQEVARAWRIQEGEEVANRR